VGYFTFEGQWRTLQVGFDFFNPEFQVSGREFNSFGYSGWAIVETGPSIDGVFRPGETVVLFEYNSFSDVVKSPGALVAFEGLIDLDGNGQFDSAIVSELSSEYILTDLDQFVDFSPFSTRVLLYKTTLNAISGQGPLPDPEPEYNVVSGTRRADSLDGTRRNDLIFGNAGNDVIRGKTGDDLIDGGAGSDRLFGDRGADSLWGGLGKDFLNGGAGPDDFWIDTRDSFDVIDTFARNDTIVIDTGVRAFRQVELSDIRIRHSGEFDSIIVAGDLVARVTGSDVALNDIFLV
jgi:hypothetical protein